MRIASQSKQNQLNFKVANLENYIKQSLYNIHVKIPLFQHCNTANNVFNKKQLGNLQKPSN